MEVLVDEGLAKEIEARAVEMARGAGKILQSRFSGPLEVEYKDDKKEQDPVTSADKESQAYLSEYIASHFPDHGIVGEEGSQEDESPAPEFLWILDPLDGTTNFLNGLPIYAVSIGVLHRGNPVAGALFIPWPGKKDGVVLHARKGGGAGNGRRACIYPRLRDYQGQPAHRASSVLWRQVPPRQRPAQASGGGQGNRQCRL